MASRIINTIEFLSEYNVQISWGYMFFEKLQIYNVDFFSYYFRCDKTEVKTKVDNDMDKRVSFSLPQNGEASSSTGSHSKSRNPAKQIASKVAKRLEDKRQSSDPSSEEMIDFLDGDDVPLVEEVAEKQFWNR